MSIFKRRKNKIKIGSSKPLKPNVSTTDSSTDIKKIDSVFDLIGGKKSDGSVLNPPKRVEIEKNITEPLANESELVQENISQKDIPDGNSYTLKKVQTKRISPKDHDSKKPDTTKIATSVSSLDTSANPLDADALELQKEISAAVDEISEMELDEQNLSIDSLSEHLINNYPEHDVSENYIEDDVFDLESLDLELNQSENNDHTVQNTEKYDTHIIENSEVNGDKLTRHDALENEDIIDSALAFETEDESAELIDAENSEEDSTETVPSIVQLRHDLSKITTDFENGDALYKRAQIRIKNLNSFAEKAELSFSLVSRLEPENRRLKARNLTLARDLETSVLNLARLETELSAKTKRVAEVSEDLEETHSQLSSALSTLSATEKELSTVKQDRDIQVLRGDREKNSYEIETRENLNLRSKISKLTDEIELLSAEKISLTNHIESMKIDMEDLQKSKESSEKNAYDVTLELEKTRDHNAEITRQISSIQEDVKSFKTQYEYNVLTRDDRIFALESELESLGKQLSLKDEILNNTSIDAQNLRKTRSDGELERERLERLIENQSQQLKLADAQLLQSRASIQEIDKRYKDAAMALARVNERRNDQAPSPSPDIRPAEGLSDMDGLEDFLTKTI